MRLPVLLAVPTTADLAAHWPLLAAVWLLCKVESWGGELGCKICKRRLPCRGVYQAAQPGFRGRCTAPLLLDVKDRRIISNESSEIVRLLNGLHLPGCTDVDLVPPDLETDIEALNALIHDNVRMAHACTAARAQPGSSCRGLHGRPELPPGVSCAGWGKEQAPSCQQCCSVLRACRAELH